MFNSKPMSTVEKSVKARKFFARNRKIRKIVYKFYSFSAISLFTLIMVCGVVIEVNDTIYPKPVLNTASASVVAHSEPTVREWVFNELRGKLGIDEAIRGVAIIQCESGWRTDIIMMNRASVDVGLWQINSVHKDISNSDKLDYKKATNWTIAKRLKDGNWSAWVCNKKI